MDNETPPTGALAPALWGCRACRVSTSERSGDCPNCGAALERSALPAEPDLSTRERRTLTRLLWLGFVLGVPLVALGVFNAISPGRPVSAALGEREFLLLQAGLCTPLVFVCAAPIFRRAWRSIRTRQLTLDTLLGLSTGAAFVYSSVAVVYAWSGAQPLQARPNTTELRPELEGGVQAVAPTQHGTVDPFFESTGMIVLLALVARALELRARDRATAALQQLTPLASRTARLLLPDGAEEERDVQLVRPGDLVRVRAHERVPVDGVIREGISTIDESMLTGESTRAERGPGGHVLAGSENGLRPLTVEATRAGHDTVLDQVLGLIGRAQQRHAAFQRATDRLVAWYVPTVLGVAFITFVGWASFGPAGAALTYATVCAVGVLVVACPCAAGLAGSVAVVLGMRRATRAGVLFRDAAALERLGAVDTVVFDKTGTLTEGKPRLVEVVPNIGLSAGQVLGLAAAVERGTEHPLGLAIVWEAVNRKLELVPAADVVGVLGKGVRGSVAGEQVSVGRLGFIQESGAHSDLMLGEAGTHRQRGHVVVFVGAGRRCAGLIVFADSLRPSAVEAVENLRAAGMRLLLVTGDHAETADGVAQTMGLEEVVADALPVEKFAIVQKLKGEGRVVAMCGDGINDAPALVAADVGVTLASGARTAISTAGVTLVRSDLRALGTARELSRATVRTIRRNLILAFAFNVFAIPIAAGVLVPVGGGLINSVWSTAAMSIGTIAVLANSMRLALYPVGK
ncbi:Silver exporting P-type ATPase [Gemmata sp. SH-PL17]|uniref:heavy metal translocating P-type ATPase n=1 Tax=Gemmata sp. SH-PL17 TaxID=1630693 RepID=UPI00078EC485|nr:heavy metal translocating P-type ATPase [Gemmata sp. SH-PL17]AMV26874.1 Silver exporting P-type ATPase [Gemmata sp. SH-PL17]